MRIFIIAFASILQVCTIAYGINNNEAIKAFLDDKITYDEMTAKAKPSVEKVHMGTTLKNARPIRSNKTYTFIPSESVEYENAPTFITQNGDFYRKIEFARESEVGSSKRPNLVNLFAVKSLTPLMSDMASGCIAVNPAPDDVFFAKNEVRAFDKSGGVACSLGEDEIGYFAYQYAGQLENGVIELEIWENNGGSMTTNSLLFVIFESVPLFENNSLKDVITIKLLGAYDLTYCQYSNIVFKGNTALINYIRSDRNWDDESYENASIEVSFE